MKGFTLIEIMVAVSIFVVVALITTGALITVSNVNRKAQAIKTAMDNVNFAMDSIVANLREGQLFNCGTAASTPNFPSDLEQSGCLNGTALLFQSARLDSSGGVPPKLIYQFGEDEGRGKIQMAKTGDTTFTDLTSPEVDIESLKFYVPLAGVGARVTLFIQGRVSGPTPTLFNLQTTVMSIF